MEQLNRKIKYWEYSNERYWRDLKFEIQQKTNTKQRASTPK